MARARTLIPWSLVLLRTLLCPAIILLASSSLAGWFLALVVLLALISDIYDGVLARRWRVETAALRLADSLADTVFYIGVFVALILRRPDLLWRDKYLLVLLLLVEATRYVVDLRKFGKAASYHSYLAKLWGFVMAVAVMVAFATPSGNWLLTVSLGLGIGSNVEGLAFSALLPSWQHDVKSLPHAFAKRRELLALLSVHSGD